MVDTDDEYELSSPHKHMQPAEMPLIICVNDMLVLDTGHCTSRMQ